MSSIVLERIDKRYGDSHAVRGIDLRIEPGSFTVLLGPSGCGKSTTLRMIAGLETPSGGRIHIGEREVTQLPPAERKLSMVFQSYALFPHLSVRENILFGVKVRKEPSRDHAARLQRVARLLGLEALLERKPSQLSGGQQQRVALGRAVISDAPVCLMDEPLSNLDAQLRHEMRREIRALQRTLGVTMVYVTHDQTEAMSMADQVVLLNQGRIEQHGTPDQIYARPATEFAARFIGTPPMNLLALETLHGVPVLAGSHGPALQGARPRAARLGIRPENMVLTRDGRWRARVTGIEYFGADSIVMCELGGAGMAAVRVPGVPTCAQGSTVGLDWSAEHQHFFDAAGLGIDDASPPAH